MRYVDEEGHFMRYVGWEECIVCGMSASSWPSRVFPHDGDDRDCDEGDEDDSDVHYGGGDGCVEGEDDDGDDE